MGLNKKCNLAETIIKMHKTVLIGFIIFLISSCQDHREIWLQDYKSTKCSWDKTQVNLKKDSIINSAKHIVKLAQIQTEIQKIVKPINSEIELLNHKIGQINIKYLNESRYISEEQERVSHNSNPEYEKRLDENERNNNREVLSLENKKTLLQLKLNDNKILQELFVKQNQIQQQIASTTRILKRKYKADFDSLKSKLDNQNSNFRMILEDLDPTEKESFKSQRDKINLNPCK
jgi:hypothetical protein